MSLLGVQKNAKRFKVKNILANATTSGEIKCHPVDNLEASASYSDDISYHDEPFNNIIYKAISYLAIKQQ